MLERIGENVERLANWTFFGVPAIPLLHAIWVTWSFRRAFSSFSPKPLEALAATFVLSFGGTTVTAIMLAQPWGWIQGLYTIPIYATVALLMYYSPADFVFARLDALAPLLAPLLIIADSVSKTLAIARLGVDAVRLHASGNAALTESVYAAILCGTIAGCGGGVLGSLLGLEGTPWSLSTPKQFRRPSAPMVVSFLSAVLYFALTDKQLPKISAASFATLALPLVPHATAIGAVFVLILGVGLLNNLLPHLGSLPTPTFATKSAAAIAKAASPVKQAVERRKRQSKA